MVGGGRRGLVLVEHLGRGGIMGEECCWRLAHHLLHMSTQGGEKKSQAASQSDSSEGGREVFVVIAKSPNPYQANAHTPPPAVYYDAKVTPLCGSHINKLVSQCMFLPVHYVIEFSLCESQSVLPKCCYQTHFREKKKRAVFNATLPKPEISLRLPLSAEL